MDYHCLHAVRILDFAHAAASLAAAAHASFGPGTAATSEWFATQQHELRRGDPDRMLAAVRALPTSQERTTAQRYLGERQEMIRYRDLSAAGWPIGSGCVESAHKHVLQARMKGPGMRWALATAQVMITLQVTIANERWEQTWSRVATQQRQTLHRRSAARRRARRPASLPSATPLTPRRVAHYPPAASARPKLIQDGKPTVDHPWRRPFRRATPRPAT